ncbi:hypothetical protein EA661_13010 [Pseudoxanthomonas winnipegensis]|uniref:Uncharacterized protein n=1 Tax=Pseudoxanthomonas winnipegensis TaxID=2480810 RepID=A0A4Q8LEN1_9GAMM|nr:hypothetical protein [Pseudoxanthomonas winnipegensis]TAA27667.1 hypothetical protein EA661_13010 [Pseudoxanthomonas winnipegensis]
MSLLVFDVDGNGSFSRTLTDLEQRQLPYALMQAVNGVAGEIKYQWDRLIQSQLDAPVKLTVNSVYLRKARYTRGDHGTREAGAAEVFIRDEAAKGTPPARYLMPQVFGGLGHDRGIDRGLRRAGWLRPGEFAVAVADNTLMDSHGNVRNGVVQQILSQLGAQFDASSNEDADAKAFRNRRARGKSLKQARNRRFFAVSRQGKDVGTVGNHTAHLSPGVYVRDGKHDLTKVYNFVGRAPTYAPRLDLFGAAERTWLKLMPVFTDRELDKAMADAARRGWA